METASVANSKGKLSAAIEKNTSVAIGTSATNSTDATSSKRLAEKHKVGKQKAMWDNKSGTNKVLAKLAGTAKKTVDRNRVVAGKQSSVSEKMPPVVNDRDEVGNATAAERKDEKNATLNSEVAATSTAPKVAVDKKVIQTKAVNNVANKEVIASNENPKNQQVKGVAEEQKTATGNTVNEQVTINKKQSVKYGDAVATKSSENAGKGTTTAHAIAAKTATRKAEKGTTAVNAVTTTSTEKAVNGIIPSQVIAAKTAAGKAKQTTGGKQKGAAKGEAQVVEEARVNVASPATVAKNMGGGQGGVKTLNTGILAAGKWKPDNSLPEETTAADYVIKKDIKPVLQASEIVVEAANKKVDSTVVAAADNALITAADSVKNDSATHKSRFVLGVKGVWKLAW
jgi:hypothetical protein